jgi:hypothetical protein
MCYQAAGPKGSDIRGDGHLPVSLVKSVIEQATTVQELQGSRVHISGGEAFLNYGETLEIFSHAASCEFHDIGATTNAFWATNPAEAERKCRELSSAGVTYLEVSMDFWHLPYVSTRRVRNLLRAARQTGIRVMVRTLSSRHHHMEELFSDFTEEEFLYLQIGNSPVAPVGRGSDNLSALEVYGDPVAEACCDAMLNLTVTPNGNVCPCCAGSDMTESLSSGNVYRHSLADIVLRMRTDQMMNQLIHGGPYTLLPVVKQLGFADRIAPAHSSICHLCWDVFRHEDVGNALRAHFQEEQFERLLDLVQTLNCDSPSPILA